ncbi:MAG: hypothetical protein N0C90_09755, partial [Candidatus Thiodiazotropha endolucinida]|nr:hypothetical protein [Candidatus Thiodiazotropha taylori]MCW4261644.1 hypothetical protein [Candidatus Thiodiazotropha endolucinida]
MVIEQSMFITVIWFLPSSIWLQRRRPYGNYFVIATRIKDCGRSLELLNMATPSSVQLSVKSKYNKNNEQSNL